MAGEPLSTEQLRSMVAAVREIRAVNDSSDAIDRLRLLEELKSASCAAQAEQAVRFDIVQRAEQATAGVPSARRGRGVASQVALARRISPHRAQRWLGWAKFTTAELPETFTELRAGRTSEWRTMLVAREASILSREHRAVIDQELAPQLESLGDRRVEAAARKTAYRLDPAAVVERARSAANDRHVSIRPAPDTMCRLSVLTSAAQGVAAYAALTRAADSVTAVGDERGRGQIMADTMIERITGQSVAGDVPTEVVVALGDGTLLGHDDNPAHLDGYGPVPAAVARELAFGNPHSTAKRWLRRLYVRPSDGQLVALESRRREFGEGMQRFLRLRDQTCRTPWCDAPIRHADHVQPYGRGGPTAVGNGQGLCEACNYARQAAGWAGRAGPDATITLRTPTSHRYRSRAPAPPAVLPRVEPRVVIDWNHRHQAA